MNSAEERLVNLTSTIVEQNRQIHSLTDELSTLQKLAQDVFDTHGNWIRGNEHFDAMRSLAEYLEKLHSE